MTSLFSHSVRSEMLALFVAESCAVALLVLALLTAGGAEGVMAAAATAIMVAICAVLVAGAIGFYRPVALQGLCPSLVHGATGAGVLALVLALLLAMLPFDHAQWSFLELLAAALAGSVAGIAATRFVFGLLRLPLPRLALVGSAAEPGAIHRNYQPFEVTLALPVGEALLEAVERGRLRAWRIWAVVSASSMPLAPADSRRCGAAGLQVFTEAEFSEHGLHRIDIDRLPDGWLASANSMRESGWSAGLRRAFDITFAIALLTLTLPLLLLTMLAIRLDGPGPIFYRQERVGRGNRVFQLLKFRSMIPDAEAFGAPVWASRGDSRVTRVGRFLRLCRIDEIPQALNVLRGDMSIIGPRPERPGFVEQLGELIPHYHDRAVIRPGITGWAQVNHPYGASVEDARMKLSYDLYYIRRRSLFLDALILLATVRVVLFQEGAR
ncbi:exopolysaccharide biosynthesis polyprenyl glycosylphosphotransferase [Roseococcus sp. SYP-B2431]|uniref:exopolysaccharide biosynthesis polyprenyl glycosylphosphotransferase n=1 Tax=Roseococcus sp. SYP-B2431 TaxID=2496640 RepID=UPI0010407ED9|nr:exopolysaccharide biosynthesis polyprenyl glycosylphosphotransferase [Roseococcus sp. SYP-B2431]TCH96290.1 exopolysaccharide biosynthesis polyprenyl glycosylphosphotransferase [Roseococcus sp. SYP-B2431]